MELPLDKIRRPLMRTRANDPVKVKDLMDSIREIGLQVPVRDDPHHSIYYSFRCCVLSENSCGIDPVVDKIDLGEDSMENFIDPMCMCVCDADRIKLWS